MYKENQTGLCICNTEMNFEDYPALVFRQTVTFAFLDVSVRDFWLILNINGNTISCLKSYHTIQKYFCTIISKVCQHALSTDTSKSNFL